MGQTSPIDLCKLWKATQMAAAEIIDGGVIANRKSKIQKTANSEDSKFRRQQIQISVHIK